MESDRYLVSIIDDGSYRWRDKGDSARCIRRISNCSQVLLSEYSATERMWPQVRDSAFIHVSYGVNKPTIPLEPWFIQHAPWQNYDVSAQYIWAYRKRNCRDQQDQDNIRPITYPLPSWRVISDPQECSMTRQTIRTNNPRFYRLHRHQMETICNYPYIEARSHLNLSYLLADVRIYIYGPDAIHTTQAKRRDTYRENKASFKSLHTTRSIATPPASYTLWRWFKTCRMLSSSNCLLCLSTYIPRMLSPHARRRWSR